MLKWAAVFFVIALVAAFFGFGGVASVAGDIAKVLFFVFLVLFVLALAAGAKLFSWVSGGTDPARFVYGLLVLV